MRFISTPNIDIHSKTWHSQLFEFKSFIRSNTQYQLIDNKVYWQCDRDLSRCVPLVPVLGTPMELEREILVVDSDAGPYWTEPLDGSFSIYDFDFESVKSQISSLLRAIPPEMGKNFHLVMDEEKIELHFFLEKDYIG